MPLAGKSYKAVQLYYVEVDEAIKSLSALGYHAINTSTADVSKIAGDIRTGVSPVIYSAPSVKVEHLQLSTNFGTGSSKDIRANQFQTIQFRDPVAATDIHKLIIYGSQEEITAVEEYVKLIDVPARQIMIEAQVIEVNVDALKDLGLKSVQGLDDLIETDITSAFPGEGMATGTSSSFIYDDTGQPAGSFSAAIQALIEDGKATIKARPKVVTVDGRQAIISIGRQVPVGQETQISGDRSIFEVTFVPVGITLNIKPRIGGGGREVQMEVDAVVSNVETINNVIADVRAPELNTREVHDIVRIPNHQSLILGGLISTETERRTFRIPILGDLPLIGELFRRSKTAEMRTEIIIVITPHIAEEVSPRLYEDEENPYVVDDIAFTPIGSDIFDQVKNILLPSNYIIKQTDIEGMDLSTLQPLVPREQIIKHSTDDPVLLTLRSIVNKLNLVEELRMLEDSIIVPDWMDDELLRYHAEAFLVMYLEETNGLAIEDMIPGRQIVIPSNPKPEEGFESSAPLWNSINFIQVTQRYEPMQGVVASLMILDGKEPPEPPKESVDLGIDESPGEGTDGIAYGPYKISLASEDGSYKLITVSFELIPADGVGIESITSRGEDIEALALAIFNDYTYEEFTSPEGSSSAAAKLAEGIDGLLGGNIVSEINLQQSVNS
jgi:Flp pilus assembly secretin CpaC